MSKKRRRRKFMPGDLIVTDLSEYHNKRILQHHGKMGVILRSAGIGQVVVSLVDGLVLRMLYSDLTLVAEAE